MTSTPAAPPAARQDHDDDRARRHRAAVLLLVCVAQFTIVLDVAIVNVALPSIRADLGFSTTGLPWVVNAYALAFGGLLLLGGRAGDLLGRRRMFLVGVATFTLASLLGGLAHEQATLVAARALQGLGAAVMAPSALAILTTTFHDPAERSRAFAAYVAAAGVGGSTAGLLGGVLTDTLGWRSILFVNVPIGIALVWRARRDLAPDGPPAPGMRRDFDLAGALTSTLGILALVVGIVRTETAGWVAAETLGPLLAGVLLLAAFVAIEARVARAPLVPLRLFASRQLTTANAATFLLSAAIFAMWFFLTLYFQQVLGWSAVVTGIALMPLNVGIAVGSLTAGRAIARFGVRRTLTAGFLLAATGLALFARIQADGSYVADALVPSILVTLGMSACLVPLTQAAVTGVPARDAGIASGLVNVARQVGGAVGLAVLTTVASSRTADLLAGHGHPGGALLHEALTAGYRRAFALAAACALVGALAVAVLLRDGGRAGEGALSDR